MTGESSMEPRDQLFATLDVTAHSGLLPSHVKVVYMDTVGFISDIPTDLIEAFTATLEDAMLAVWRCYAVICLCPLYWSFHRWDSKPCISRIQVDRQIYVKIRLI